MMRALMRLFSCLLFSALASCATPLSGVPAAETIYRNGPILTMEAAQPQAEALAVAGGRILAVGSEEAVLGFHRPGTRVVDLAGRTLMPGFFDGHSHLTLTAAKLAVVNLDPPPAGPASSIAAIQAALRAGLETSAVEETGWLVGWGYDHTMLSEARHPTRKDLDAVSDETPILLIHFSSHQAVVNSAGLTRMGIDAETPDPAGGRIGRVLGSREPNGLLQENAIFAAVFPVLDALLGKSSEKSPPNEAALRRVEHSVERYASQGFTTATEMALTPGALRLLDALNAQDRLAIDVIGTALANAFSAQAAQARYSRDYTGRLRVGGAKLILDGGSPGRSAYLRAPYHVQLPGEEGYRGYPHQDEQAKINSVVAEHLGAGHPVYIHALGDAAVDQAINALRAVHAVTPDAARGTQLIHVQQAQPDQLDAIAELGAGITFQVAHNFYFGDFHRSTIFGPERTERLNPAREALDREISTSLHHDSPVHPVDPWMLIWTAVNRTTRSGTIIGPGQRISVEEALHASTLAPARQFREGDEKGSLQVGKRADLILLDRNPLEIDPTTLREVRVLETIKDGVTIYRAEPVD